MTSWQEYRCAMLGHSWRWVDGLVARCQRCSMTYAPPVFKESE